MDLALLVLFASMGVLTIERKKRLQPLLVILQHHTVIEVLGVVRYTGYELYL